MNVLSLKLIALTSMIIDHYGAIFQPNKIIYRAIGRLAFPIYAFLLVEGYFHTKNLKRYGLRLLIFALVSEIPFDYAFYGGLSFRHQNIFFTLFIGLIVIHILEKYKTSNNLGKSLAIISLAFLSEALFTDYGLVGIIYIVSFYNGRKISKNKGLIVAGLSIFIMNLLSTSIIQQLALFSLPLIFLYNGELGPKNRLLEGLFYLSYPVHLLIFYLLSTYI